jgi:hypothetical protein
MTPSHYQKESGRCERSRGLDVYGDMTLAILSSNQTSMDCWGPLEMGEVFSRLLCDYCAMALGHTWLHILPCHPGHSQQLFMVFLLRCAFSASQVLSVR